MKRYRYQHWNRKTKTNKNEHGCEFIKINSDKENVHIFKAVDQIRRRIKKSSKESTKESTKISLKDNLSKKLLKLESKKIIQ